MTPAQQDIAHRRPVWRVLSDLFLDTELQDHDLIRIAATLAESCYSLADVETILYREVYPVCIGNLSCMAGEWAGFDNEWLAESILRRSGRSWALMNFLEPRRWMIRRYWKRIKVLYPIFADNVRIKPLAVALRAMRSIVVLHVPWSHYAMRAVALLDSASSQIEPLGVTTAVVDEESREVRAWLRMIAPRSFDCVPRGSGDYVWLERGSVIDIVLGGDRLTMEELLARTRSCLLDSAAD
jgi:hypothetical protein